MKKYTLPLLFILILFCSSAWGIDFGTLLERLDSRDFSAEKDVALKNSGPYTGETINPHEETVMFKARAELLTALLATKDSPEKTAEINDFIANSLGKNVQADTKAWLLEQLSLTGTAKEVPALVPLLTSDDRRLVDAAAATLGKIHGAEATTALEQHAGIPAVKAALICRHATIPPLSPNETVMPLGLSNVTNEKFDQWMAQYDQLDESKKIQTLAALTVREDRKYRDKMLAALASDSVELKKAGFLALEKLATKDDIDLLLAGLVDHRDLAIRIGGFIVAEGFDDALLAKFRQTTDLVRFLDLATLLINRSIDIRADVFAKTTAPECPDRLALLQGVAKIVTADDIPSLVASTVLIPRGKDRDAAENLIASVCGKDASPLIQLIGIYPPAIIYPVMCRAGGEAAKKELLKGLESTDPTVLEAALSALSQWSDAAFADKMMEIVTSEKYQEGMTTAVLRGYIRVISLPDDKIGVALSADDKLAKLKKAFELSKRPDEKRLILSRLAANRTIKSLEFALECAADPPLADAAYLAIADHAHDTILREQYRDIVLKAIELVIAHSKDAQLVERVKTYKGRM